MPQIVSSFKYALKGIVKLFSSERNAQIHLIATSIVIVLGFYFDVSNVEWCLLILAIGIVLGAEGFNTALEHTVDIASPQIQDKAGDAKDIAAGAVLITAICAAIIGALIFGPKIFALLSP